MSGPTFQDELNRLHSEGKFMDAVELLTRAIKDKPDMHELFLLRAHDLFKLEKFKESASDAGRAATLGAGVDAYMIQGKALFRIGKFKQAYDAFKQGKSKAGNTGAFDEYGQWMAWSEERFKKQEENENKQKEQEKTKCVQESLSESTSNMTLHKDTKTEDRQSNTANKSENSPSNIEKNTMPTPKIKHDWYQTESQVCITIMIKQKENVKVEYTESTVSASCKLPSGSEYSLELDLCHPILPERSSYKVLSTKIEVKLAKRDSIRWNTLEGDGAAPAIKAINVAGPVSSAPPAYPTSYAKKHDWNKLEADVKKEEEEEKLEGDAALNQLFQKIYSQGNEETRRAMNKSFSESGGTVLSTNWKEVATDKVDVKPPDGMEYKSYNQ